MKRFKSSCTLGALTLALALGGPSGTKAQTHSKYAGEEKRAIKSLSANDIAELQRGGGWGFAKAAELNGMPGPSHLLEMKEQVELTAYQIAGIRAVYQSMRAKATALGKKFIQFEQELDRSFRDGSISHTSLTVQLQRISNLRVKLRETHLSAHLRIQPLLSEKQIAKYNKLRGYSNSDPCETPPKGHSTAMWRKHNGCD